MTMAEEEKDIITVGKRNNDGTAVWDRHEYHPSNYGSPEGEVFISDMRPYQAHRSRGIQQKIGEKELQELGERAASARTAAYDEEAQKKEEQQKALQEQQQAMPHATFVGPGVVPKEVPNVVTPRSEQPQDKDEDEDEESEGKTPSTQSSPSEETGTPQVRRPTRPSGS